MARLFLAVVLVLLAAKPVSAQEDRFNCEDLTQARAQRILDRDPSDPNQLDGNNNGEACEEFFEGTDSAEPAEPAPEELVEDDPPPPAQEDLFDCEDFTSPARPQRILEREPSDPHGLDANQNGEACEEFFAGDDVQDAPADPPQVDEDVELGDAGLPTAVSEDLDCVQFAYQEDAQAVLDQDRRDPHNLDPSGDGFACTSLPYRVAVTRLPSTGTGSMAAVLAAAQK